MIVNEFDTCIIGQGLAGTALAWALRWRGHRVAVIDRGERNTSSRIAAGLITPVTGQRCVKSWRFDEFWPHAVAFYRRIETETGDRFFNTSRMVRLFANPSEREIGKEKALREFPELVAFPKRIADSCFFDSQCGGFEMIDAGRLDVARYLDVSRKAFFRHDGCIPAAIDPAADLQLEDRWAFIPKLGLRSRHVIFCQGFAGAENPWFRGVPFDAAKGEILTLRIPELNEGRVIHRGIWLAPAENGLYRVGSTYDRDRLDGTPTPAGRDELCSRLREFLKIPFDVVRHQAAVRPIIAGRRPAIGFHPEFPQLGYFNGLASKGSLQAPWLAGHFADVLTEKACLLPEFDVAQRADLHGCGV